MPAQKPNPRTMLALSFCLSAAALAFPIALMAQSVAQDTSVFRSIEEALRDPEHVRRLDLSNLALGAFPVEVLRFTHLEELRLRHDGITDLPSGIGALKELRLLDISGNPIRTLPEEFGELEALEVLFLNEDEALDLDADIDLLARLPKLRELHLERDGLTQLPRSMLKLRKLEALYLNENRFTRFPELLLEMPSLKLIDLNKNPIDPLFPLDLQQRGVLVRF